MKADGITITREHLHDMILAEPVRTVAARLGISDRGLARICHRLRVPMPGHGYWQRRAVGREDVRQPLPPLAPDATEGERRATVIPTTPSRKEREPSGVTLDAAELERAPDQMIQVQSTLTDPHPLVDRTARALRKARRDHRGLLVPEQRRVLDVRVTSATLDRALLVADALMKALTNRGYPMTVDALGEGGTSVQVSGEQLSVVIEEVIRRVELPPAKPFRQSLVGYVLPAQIQYNYIPTGNLRLRITDGEIAGTRRTWQDTSKRRLESRLNSFVIGLLHAADAKKEARRRREEWRRALEERERLESERRLRQMEEESKIHVLEGDLMARARSLEVHEYVTALRSASADRPMDDDARKNLDDWLDWAHTYAVRLDPAQRCSAPRARAQWEPK